LSTASQKTDPACARLDAAVAEHVLGLDSRAARAWGFRHHLHHLGCTIPAAGEEGGAERLATLRANLAHVHLWRLAVDVAGERPIAPLKGIALLASVHADDLTARPMLDVDVLVRACDIGAIAAGLRARGHVESAESRRGEILAHHRKLIGRHGALELHHRLWDNFGPQATLDALPWRAGEVHGVRALVPEPAVTALHLLVHALENGLFSSLGRVREVMGLAAGLPGPPAPQLADLARRVGAANATAAAVAGLREALGEDCLPGVDLDQLHASPARLALFRRLQGPAPRRVEDWGRGASKMQTESACAALADGLRATASQIRRRLVGHVVSRLPALPLARPPEHRP
jgi:hypothetical protein